MIAHRLSTLPERDTILVLNHGRLVEQGTHDELLAARRAYRQLHDMQTGQARRRPGASGGLSRSGRCNGMHIAHQTAKRSSSGMMSKMPVAGIVFLTVQYLVGLKRLGFDVYYVEAHGQTPCDADGRYDSSGGGCGRGGIHRRPDASIRPRGRPLGVPRAPRSRQCFGCRNRR